MKGAQEMPKTKFITRVLPVTKVIAKVARIKEEDIVNTQFYLPGKKTSDEKILRELRFRLPEDEIPLSLILIEELKVRFSMPLEAFLTSAQYEEVKENEEEDE